jgi:ABC-type protease/lipase transport system fused ATPase/permease subunit
MTVRQAFAGMLQFFAVLVLLGAGLCFVGLFFIPELSFALEDALLQTPNLLAFLGFGLIAFSLFLMGGLLSVNRGRVLLLRMGTSVDEKLIQQTIAPLLQKHFAARIVLSNVQILRGRDLALALTLVPMEEGEREKLLLEAEKHLQVLLIERFGYSQPFTVQALI